MEIIFNIVYYVYWILITIGFIVLSIAFLLLLHPTLRNSIYADMDLDYDKRHVPEITFLFFLLFGTTYDYMGIVQVHSILSAFTILTYVTSALCFMTNKPRNGFKLLIQGSMYYWILIYVFNGDGLWLF